MKGMVPFGLFSKMAQHLLDPPPSSPPDGMGLSVVGPLLLFLASEVVSSAVIASPGASPACPYPLSGQGLGSAGDHRERLFLVRDSKRSGQF